MSTRAVALLALAALSACNGQAQPRADKDVASAEFPAADRPVSPISSSRWSTEEARDRVQEADRVMDLAGIGPGMTVADIGAGEGYYTVRLAERVGARGRVLAQDVVPAVRDRLAARVYREQLDNVSVKLGGPADPKLPADSFDRILMVHMYHEIAAPYEFLWRMRPSLRPEGRIVIVDTDRPTAQHGTPRALLDCELASVGLRKRESNPLPQAGVYVSIYEAGAPRPEPKAIRACRNSG
jgi:ubiquinone/menaquinone biosynthesis C-methylase UbiE